MNYRSFAIFFLIILIIISSYLSSKIYDLRFNNSQVKGATTKISKDVGVWAFLGECRFNLYGYTSPKALVTIEGAGIYDQTYSDDQGYFQFASRFSPFSPREACLSAKDQFGRTSPPTCLPPFPVKYDVSIGPVILPPTLSLDKQNYYLGDEIVLAGQTIPDSEVNLSMFTKANQETTKALNSKHQVPNKSKILNSKRFGFKVLDLGFISDFGFRISDLALVKPVEAFSLPEFQTKSDNKGNFSISLPSTNFDSYRLFAQTYRDSFPSNKSNTLNLKILPWWMIIINFLLFLFFLLKPWLIEIIILLELIVVAWYLINHFFIPHEVARNRALTVRNHLGLLKEETDLLANPKF